MKRRKRFCALLLAAVLLLTCAPTVTAADGMIVMNLGSNVMTVNGETVAIDTDPAIKPQVKTVNGFGYTMLPLRAVVESMGGTVAYDAATQNITMTYGGTTMTHVIGTATAWVDGVSQPLAIASYAANNRTYVHLRAIELLSSSITVNWNTNDRDRVVITYPQSSAQPPVVIIPDEPPSGNTGDAPIVSYPDGTESDAPVDMELHICNMLGEDFTITTLLLGESAGSGMFSQNIDDLYCEEPEILSLHLTPGLYNINGHASGGIYYWKGIQFTGGTQYLNLYNNGVFYRSEDPGVLGQSMAELGLESSRDDTPAERTVKVTLHNSTGDSIKGLKVYQAASTLAEPIFETEETILWGKELEFELDYSSNASEFIIIATVELRVSFDNGLKLPMSYRYGSMDLSGDAATVTLEERGDYTVSLSGQGGDVPEEEYYIPFV